HFYAVFTGGLARDQLLIGGVAAIFGHPQPGAEVAAARRVQVEGASQQLVGAVAQGAGAVLVAHLTGAAATHHAPAQGPCGCSFSVYHVLILFKAATLSLLSLFCTRV